MMAALISLGSNQGDRPALLTAALEHLAAHPEFVLRARSRFHETTAAGGPADQPPYLNAVAHLDTTLAPSAVLNVLLDVERLLGRQRSQRWDARTLDLDLLLYEQLVISSDQLAIPHPRMTFRRFVLEPAAEIAGQWMHPVSRWTIAQLLKHLDEAPNYLALTGAPVADQTTVARAVARPDDLLVARNVLLESSVTRTRRDDSSAGGSPRTTSLELLLQRFERIVAAGQLPAAADSRWIISDFWWGELPIWQEAAASDQLQAELLPSAVVSFLARPKLLVFWDVPIDQLVRHAGSESPGADRDRWSVPQAELYLERLRERIGAHYQGPLLHLTTSDVEEAVAEVRAALEAMHR